jgi:hypothetical protein
MKILQEIIHTLSDTELIVLAEEINNPKISKETIFNQIMAKSNKTQVSNSSWDKLTKFLSYIDPTDPKGIKELPELLALEISKRLKSSNIMKCKCGPVDLGTQSIGE